MRISDWSSDVCSSDLLAPAGRGEHDAGQRCRDAEPARLYARPEDHGIPRHAWGTDPGRRKLAGARRSDVRDLPLWQGRRWSAVRRFRVEAEGPCSDASRLWIGLGAGRDRVWWLVYNSC